jgi:CO dehydrogenase/acetyl-CoA synthase gamma subunit (corrinoid Fe-S protein)
MYYDILEASYIGGYRLELTFENGKKGIVDLKGYINKGGVFSRFSEIEYFKQFYVNKEIGTLCWPDGVDIAPETLYHEATGEPLPSWMTKEKAMA